MTKMFRSPLTPALSILFLSLFVHQILAQGSTSDAECERGMLVILPMCCIATYYYLLKLIIIYVQQHSHSDGHLQEIRV